MSELDPLFRDIENRTRGDSRASALLARLGRSRASTTVSVRQRRVRKFTRKRFFWFCFLGVIALIILNLSFLPRTLLSRDFRRWHDLHLTKTDLKRIFLAQLKRGRPDDAGKTTEHRLNEWLGQLADASEKPAVASSENPRLTKFVRDAFASVGYKPHEMTYSANSIVPAKVALQLFDDDGLIYSAPLSEGKNPAFFPQTNSGKTENPYIFANTGSPEDFNLLSAQKVSVKDRTVLFSQNGNYSVADRVHYAWKLGCSGVVVFGENGDEVLREFRPSQPYKLLKLAVPASHNAIKPIISTFPPGKGKFASWPRHPVPEKSEKLRLSLSVSLLRDLSLTNIMTQVSGVINDAEIVVGASRDSLSSRNPLSGHAIMLEVMREFKRLEKMGWRPLRTIRFFLWDGSRSGALGSGAAIDDPRVFPLNMPLLAYINLDDDAVTGGNFSVELSPLFNHILQETARFIPVPKEKKADEFNSDNSDNSDDDLDDDETTLHKVWKHQSKNSINNKLGGIFTGTNAGTFQFRDTPTVNFAFRGETYVPGLNSYNDKWVRQIDPGLEKHGLLVRYIGLLAISLCEHEMVDVSTRKYMAQVGQYFSEIFRAYKPLVGQWWGNVVDETKFGKSKLYLDALEASGAVTFGRMADQFGCKLNETLAKTGLLDDHSVDVQDSLTRDYPWYQMLSKVHIWAKFKVTNYEILRAEKELAMRGESGSAHNFVYEPILWESKPPTNQQRLEKGAFATLWRGLEEADVEILLAGLAARYERLVAVCRYI